MSRFDLDNFLPYQLAVLSQRVSEGFARHYRERFGINVAEWRVVAHLSQEDAVSVREICRRVNMDKPKVSRAASRLEAAGFVRKEENPADRRLVKLSLTGAGRAMVDELAPIAQSYEEELAALMGEDDFSRFRGLVGRLNTGLAARAPGKGGGA
ncbi:MAG TPA: MarR family transcriptional regulator [Aliiroseovarius sp.]|nr:MarR family transcriptional regulator [Aliiroseovarius sp.]